MKIYRKFIYALFSVCFFSGNVFALSPAEVATGKGENGEYVLPATLAQECEIVLKDTEKAAKDVKKCFENLLASMGKDAGEAKHAQDLMRRAVKESRIGTLEVMLAEKIYAANYKEEVIDKFEKNMSGEAAGESSVLDELKPKTFDMSKDGGGAEAAEEHEDWMNTATADRHLASQLNSHFNNVLATEIMYRALEYISGYDGSYLEQEQ